MPPQNSEADAEDPTMAKAVVYGDEEGGGAEDNDTVRAVNKYTPGNEPGKAAVDENADAAVAVQQTEYPPSLFTNERGNLKVVALVVRNPCAIFWVLIALCVILSFLLQVVVFRAAEGGNPFTLPGNEFDLADVRSVQYDSYRLARDELRDARNALASAGKESVKRQSEVSDIAYWVFEGETEGGLFGSREAIEGMKDAYDIFTEDPEFEKWCVLEYPDEDGGFGPFGRSLWDAAKKFPDAARHLEGAARRLDARRLQDTAVEAGGEAGAEAGGETDAENDAEAEETAGTDAAPTCRAPLSPLAMYYPAEWDGVLAAQIIDEFKDPANVERFNKVAVCATSGQFCDLLSDDDMEDLTWARQLSLKVFGMSTQWDMSGELVEDFQQVTELASYLKEVDVFKGLVDFGFDENFSVDNPVSQFSRGILFWGGPLEDRTRSTGPTADEDDADDEAEDKDEEKRKEKVIGDYLDLMNEQSELGKHSEINSYYFMTTIIGDVILDIVTKDALLAIFSFVFVFVWIRVNTQSWFLAWVGFFEILFSIPVSWFIYTVVFRIKYFATLNSLALFVVAAIGADDIFIFMDAYKQSRYHPEVLTDLETRMSWVYRRTGKAMAITSATTCAAFLCTLITPLPSLQSFGIFAAFVIFIDYVLVMSLFCTATVIYHNRFEKSACFGCCCPCGLVAPTNTEQALAELEGSDGEVQRDRVSEFFKNRVAGFVKVPLHRAILGVVFLVWLGVAIWQASLLEATKENEQFLDEDNPLQKSFTILGSEFPTADDDIGLKIHYVWGAGEVDRSGVNRLLEPEDYGKPTFAPGFEFNDKCQADLLDFCDRLKTDPKYSELIKRKDGLGLVNCFVEELGAYNVARALSLSDNPDHDQCDYMRGRAWTDAGVPWQVDPNDMESVMTDFLKSKTCMDEDGRDTVGGQYQDEIGWDGRSLRYAAVSAESKVLDPFGLDAEALTRGEYDQFVDIAEEQGRIISGSCGGDVIMTDLNEKFVFMNNQAIYVRSATQSAILGVCIAFVVLLISTRVFHIAFFASLSITAVLVSVLGMMVMLGWNLGSIESTLIGIIAGFSVDYVVHLAHAYEIAQGDTYARVTEAFGDLGISVFNGMITSVVASIPLFFCQLQFFAKFGTFLCLVIAFSWIFANFAFMSLLAQLKIPIKEGGRFRL